MNTIRGQVLTDSGLQPAAIDIEAGRIAAIRPDASAPADILAPGLVDVHIHGCAGKDFTTHGVAALADMGPMLLEGGVTGYLPTLMCAKRSGLQDVMRDMRKAFPPEAALLPDASKAATPLGIHMEGPFIAAARKGAQPEDGIYAAEDETLSALLEAGNIRRMTIAPELPGAIALIRRLVALGISVSLGHSAATADEAKAAIDAGAHSLTHTFNAMNGLHHREPGLLGQALVDDRVTCELIADGIHVDPRVVKLLMLCKRGNIALVSDAIMATGMADGSCCHLGSQPVCVQGGKATLSDGTIAGSTLTLLNGLRSMLAWTDAPLEVVWRMASSIPAKMLGIKDRGWLAPGMVADILRLTPDLKLKAVIHGGKDCF